jgi:hypothetical protein
VTRADAGHPLGFGVSVHPQNTMQDAEDLWPVPPWKRGRGRFHVPDDLKAVPIPMHWDLGTA